MLVQELMRDKLIKATKALLMVNNVNLTGSRTTHFWACLRGSF